MRIKQRCDVEPLNGESVYRRTDYALDFTPSDLALLASRVGDRGTTSITIGTLQIEVAVESGLLLYVWGYHPHTAWSIGTVQERTGIPCAAQVVTAEPLVSGISRSVEPPADWFTTYDPNTAWIRIYRRSADAQSFIEFAAGVCLGLGPMGYIDEIRLKIEIEDV